MEKGMNNIIQISEAASIAIHTCLWLAHVKDDSYSSAPVICSQLHFSKAHFAKVMQVLDRHGLVETMRGPKGGVRLARKATEISVLDVYKAVEGPSKRQGCLLLPQACPGKCCAIGKNLLQIGDMVKDLFAKTTLADLKKNVEWKISAN